MLIVLLTAALMLASILLAMAQMPGGFEAVAEKLENRITQTLHPPEPTPEPTPIPTPAPAPAPTPAPTPEPTPIPKLTEEELELELLRRMQDADSDFLTLVNPWNYIDPDYVPELLLTENEQYIDARIYDALMTMVYDCRDAGNDPFICSGYRTQEYQQMLFDNKIERVVYSGYSWEEAPAIAAMSVAVPGTSEHQLGLAVDLIDYYYPNLDYTQEDTATQKWLMENSWKYGFILRYPNGTSDITGIIYEPWHYRYVGKLAAAEIYHRGITFEEYLELLYPDNNYNK